MAEVLLQVCNLKTQFHTKNGLITAVDDVSFHVNKGETLGIVGESGCGKSVTSFSILQLLSPVNSRIAAGRILFLGEDLLKKDRKEMQAVRGRDIAMVFQDSLSALNPVIPVGKQIVEAIRAHQRIPKKNAKEITLEMLRKVGIPSPEQRFYEYPHQLSGGMRQRAFIAMALCCNAKLLIADEPTTALDVTIQAQILELMRQIKADGERSLILITHDMGVVAEMADRVVVMYAGKVMEISDTVQMFRNPLHPYSQGLLASIPRPDKSMGRLYAIQGSVPSSGEIQKGCRFCNRCDKKIEICGETEPELIDIDGRQVRCHLYCNREGV